MFDYKVGTKRQYCSGTLFLFQVTLKKNTDVNIVESNDSNQSEKLVESIDVSDVNGKEINLPVDTVEPTIRQSQRTSKAPARFDETDYSSIKVNL